MLGYIPMWFALLVLLIVAVAFTIDLVLVITHQTSSVFYSLSVRIGFCLAVCCLALWDVFLYTPLENVTTNFKKDYQDQSALGKTKLLFACLKRLPVQIFVLMFSGLTMLINFYVLYLMDSVFSMIINFV